jgi:hypothetical protein
MAELTGKQEELIKYLSGMVAESAYRAGSKMLDLLILTNGGAAVACLGMIASESPHADDYAGKLLLMVFIIGLALAGVLTVRGFLYTTRMTFDFGDTVARMRAGSAQWGALQKLFQDMKPKQFYTVNVWIGGASLVMFGIGAIGACTWLLIPQLTFGMGEYPMRRTLNVTGLILSIIGVLLIWRWGPPQPTFERGVGIGLEEKNALSDGRTVAQHDADAAANEIFYRRMSKLGLGIILIGFVFQLGSEFVPAGHHG